MSDDLKRKITDLPLIDAIDRLIEERDRNLLEKTIRAHADKAGAGARSVANAKVPAKFGDDFIDVQVRIPVGKGLSQNARQKIADALSTLIRETVDNNLDKLRHSGLSN